MICSTVDCPRRVHCSNHCLNRNLNENTDERIADLYVYGYGVGESWLCGEYGDWGMLKPYYNTFIKWSANFPL